ncbi:MAG: glycosyltransferase family 2 protein [Bdellovibrionales bacterium]|nr:glycosyltransferase family 2 protein [Bdellovibrionales bacterium]
MKLSIVIPTIGRTAALRRCLSSLVFQADPGFNFEIIVVSNPGQQAVAEVVEEFSLSGTLIRYLALEQSGANRARNLGASVATGRYLLFLDDDTELAGQDFLLNLTEFIEGPRAEVAWGGYYLSPSAADFSSRAYNCAANLWLMKSCKAPRRRPVMVGGCTLVDRQVFTQVGGFDLKQMGAAEELALSQRVQAQGHRVVLNRKLSVHHHFQGGWVRALGNAYRHGRAKPSTQDPRLDSIPMRQTFSLVRRSLVLDQTLERGRRFQFLIPSLAAYYVVVLVGATVGRWKLRSEGASAPALGGIRSSSGQ